VNTAELYRVRQTEDTHYRESRPQQQNVVPLPTWNSLEQEIHDRLIQLKKLTLLGVTGGLQDSLEQLNKKVVKYNELVPAPSLQKPMLTKETFLNHLQYWE
jgi:hypothetical protein